MKLNDSFLAQMRDAANLLRSEGPMAATAAIQRALHGAGPQADTASSVRPDLEQDVPTLHDREVRDINPLDDAVRDESPARSSDLLARFRTLRHGAGPGVAARQFEDVAVHEDANDEKVNNKGRFIAGSCTNAAGSRAYKLYIPSGYAGQPLPLIVMLHGCTQNPDDFARGTGMNAAAEEHNCFVVYPAQSKSANGSNCWNWFQPADQQRERGEPSILADIVRQVAREYKTDPRRTYVAGLSAGGAMAAILGAAYPDLFAAIGIHSGLPAGAAHDVPSAFAAMKSRRGKVSMRAPMASGKPPAPPLFAQTVPVIVFHGDRDNTVHPSNGDKALQQCLATAKAGANVRVEQGSAPSGKAFTRAIHLDAQGRAVAEKWSVHGAGHAWAGGSSKGTYTDPEGPDATREMLRFFLTHSLDPRSAA